MAARNGAAAQAPYAKLPEDAGSPKKEGATDPDFSELTCCGMSLETTVPRSWRSAYLFGPSLDCLFMPNSHFPRHLGYAMLAVFFYSVFGLPFRLAFLTSDVPWIVSLTLVLLDYIGDITLILYIFVKTRTSLSARGFADPYLFSVAFYRDVCAVIPLEIVAYAAGARLPLAYRFNRFLFFASINSFTSAWERRATHANQLRLARTCIIVIILVHWVACGYMGIVNIEGYGLNKWVMPDEPLFRSNVDFRYMYSFYWALAFMFGVSGDDLGSPKTRLELYFTAAVIVTGFSVVAAVVGNVANLITNMNAAEVMFRQRMDVLKQWMSTRQLSKELQSRVLSHFDFMWARQRGLDDRAVLRDLPEHLAAEVNLSLNRDILNKVSLFSNADPAFIHELVTKLKPCLYGPGEYIVRVGEKGHEMFFISKGTIEVTSADGKQVFVTMTDGEYFGEIALLYADKRTASVRAKTYCDLFTLHKNDMDEVLQDYPEMHAMLREIARSRATEGRVKASKPAATPGTSGTTTPGPGTRVPSFGHAAGARIAQAVAAGTLEPAPSGPSRRHGSHNHVLTPAEFEQQVRIHRAQWALRVLRRFVRAWLMFKRGGGGPNIGGRKYKSIFDVYTATKQIQQQQQQQQAAMREGDPSAIDALASDNFGRAGPAGGAGGAGVPLHRRVSGASAAAGAVYEPLPRRGSGASAAAGAAYEPPMFSPPPYVRLEGGGDDDEGGIALTARSDGSGAASPRPLLPRPHPGDRRSPEPPPQTSILGSLWDWATNRSPPARPSESESASRRGRVRGPTPGANSPQLSGMEQGGSERGWRRAYSLAIGNAAPPRITYGYADDDGGGGGSPYTRYTPPGPASVGRMGGRYAGLAGNLDPSRARRASAEWATHMQPVPVMPQMDPLLLESDEALIGCLPGPSGRRHGAGLPSRARRQSHGGGGSSGRPPSPDRSGAPSPNTMPASFEV